ncbi:MAG: cell envelope integrity EipB family protein [Roseomonas sp.]|nr:cell envelope integrity EipB family protein [Roseomonas sp.]MCA3326173.1 cell envelope integrity EipB family protein [Roseomonas sp.]MCA3330279.1 cell envelope integrity EipB family protein [Roseomonas sp.]MCA3335271.1 cell envelope integrity EipB family protein [Roseomonas sp.]MCA3346293.1 cell envelope integrity EipB family protein [Roseomonas sp.]
MRFSALLALALILPATPGLTQGTKDAPAAAPLTARALASHRGIYELSLDRARENAGIIDVSGAMLFELIDACESWASRQRFTMTLRNREGTELETGSDYATLESMDGRNLRFSLTQVTQGAVSSRVVGQAELVADGSGVARYSEPEAKELPIPPGTLLPNTHTIAALNAARAGQRLLVAPIFDGTSADGAQQTTTFLSPWQGPQPVPEAPSLSTLGSSRMRIAFFEPGAEQAGGASTPSYEVSLRYFENGVADDMIMDFGEFTVRAKLIRLEEAPGGC